MAITADYVRQVATATSGDSGISSRPYPQLTSGLCWRSPETTKGFDDTRHVLPLIVSVGKPI
jgi:hypothetical protein